MSRNKYDLHIHRLLGNAIDISLVWHLFLDGDNTVIINGQKVVYYCPMADYIELEKLAPYGHYRVKLQINNVVYNKTFKLLEDAISYRDEILKSNK